MNKTAFAFSLTLLLSGALPVQAQLFGPSDEEKAREAAQDQGLAQLGSQAQQLESRIQAQEDKVRALTDTLARATGTNEELRHQIDLLNQKIDSQKKDFSYRLCMVSAQQLGADAQGLNCAGAANGQQNFQAAAPSQPGGFRPGQELPPVDAPQPPGNFGGNFGGNIASGAPTPLARPPGLLGTLPGDSAGPRNSLQFDSAMNLLAKAQYDEAKAQFRAYADANADDADLSPQAIYWVGNIDYIQRDYPGAITAFAEQIKKYPKSPRGPDSMLKLGQSLLAMGRTNEGCTTLGAIKSKFPDAPPATLSLAAGTRKASCSK